MFNFSKRPCFGLDLSNLSFKIVQLKKEKGKLSLSSFIKKDIPKGLVEDGEIKKEKELSSIIKGSLKEVNGRSLQGRRVICNLPEERVFIRIIQLPKMKKEEIDQAVKWEAEAHIPLSIDEVYLSWQVIDLPANNSNQIDVLIAASPKKLVDSYMNLLKESGLKPIALEPESVAVVRSLISPNDFTPTIIVDLGISGTNFVIFSASTICFTSHIRISGNLFSQVIMKELKVEAEEANKLKIKIGLDKTKGEKVYQVLKPIINDLAKQINDYIAFYHDHVGHIHSRNGTIKQVLLCGGDSLLLNLPSFLSKQLDMPVKIGDPLINILSDKKERLAVSNELKKPLAYTTALGLALRPYYD
ncbi:MAG: type IV pilus assembly protein PilM [Parcubacteria group bacterium]|nr:type IV pilus assembly protein PilM [Parcubacteria group bacterium]